MFSLFYYELKNWWLGETVDYMEEFELMESKHTRVHHEEEFYDMYRYH